LHQQTFIGCNVITSQISLEEKTMRIKDKYISPFTDFGFKKLFGTEMNKDIW
jgi:hypothetical protein